MKVLKPGRDQKGWSIEVVCSGKGNGGGGCGALLLVEQKDLYLTHSHIHTDHDIHVTFECCECNVETDIDKVPENVKRELK